MSVIEVEGQQPYFPRVLARDVARDQRRKDWLMSSIQSRSLVSSRCRCSAARNGWATV